MPTISTSFAQSTRPHAAASVSKLLVRGDSLVAAFENVGAQAYYEEAFRLDSTGFDVLLRLTRIHTMRAKDLLDGGRKREAENTVRESVRLAEIMTGLYPDNAETQFQMAAAYGNYALFKGGRAKLEIGRRIEGYCLTAIQLDREFAPPYMVLGIFYRKIAELNWVEKLLAKTLFGGLPEGGREKAERYLMQAVELEPEMILGWYELGVTRQALRDIDGARLALDKASALPPRNASELRTQARARRLLPTH